MNALQQGDADGLCGLYSILNFLRTIKGWAAEGKPETFELVLEAVQAEGLLTPDYITKGFQVYQIAAILNRVFASYLMPFRAVQIVEIEFNDLKDWFDKYNTILECGGSIIGGPEGRDHWVVVTTMVSGEKVILNSADKLKPKKPFTRRQRFCAQVAVAILPYNRSSISIG